ncbi:MAG TPA: class I SAM-dependent methyltransferase, partial [Thermoanaerobaculia bacterium]|nr:class I SAM-dependent methyltransferase [Thermoanaerobaculia bacterium]
MAIWSGFRDRRRVERVFTEIYRAGAWGSRESVSGPGSTQARATDFLPGLLAMVRDLGTATLLDAPCGDFNWAAPLAEAVERYIGVDVVPDLVARNRERFGSPRRRFLRKD